MQKKKKTKKTDFVVKEYTWYNYKTGLLDQLFNSIKVQWSSYRELITYHICGWDLIDKLILACVSNFRINTMVFLFTQGHIHVCRACAVWWTLRPV